MTRDIKQTLDQIAAAEAAAGGMFTAGRLEPMVDPGLANAKLTLRVATEVLASSPEGLRDRLLAALHVAQPFLGSPETFLPFEAAAFALELRELLLPQGSKTFEQTVREMTDEAATTAARLLVQLSAQTEDATTQE